MKIIEENEMGCWLQKKVPDETCIFSSYCRIINPFSNEDGEKRIQY